MKYTAMLYQTFILICTLMLLVASSGSYAIALDEQRQLFTEADKALKKGKKNLALKVLPKLKDYPLYPYLLYKSLLGRKNQLSKIESYLEKYADTPYANSLRNNQLKLLASQKKWNAYVSLYENSTNTELRCNYQWALHKTGNTVSALKGASQLWLTGQSQPAECDALFNLLKEHKMLTSDLVWRRFSLALRAGNVSFARYLKKSLPKKLANNATFWLKVYQSPQSTLVKWQSWPDNKELYSEIFVHGLERLALKNLSLSNKIWQEGKNHFAVDSLQSAQLQRLISLKMVKNRHPQALSSLFSLTTKQDNEQTRQWRVRAALLSRDWNRVEEALDRLTIDEQASSRWKYWKARMLEALGHSDVSTQLYQEIAGEREFYGFLAADRIKQNYSLNNRPIDVSARSTQALENTWHFRAMKEFLVVNHELDARRLWWYKSQRLDHSELLSAAKLADQWGWHDVAIFTAARAKQWDDIELRFPLAYKEHVLKYSANAQLRPSLVYGVIRRESAFRTNVSSKAGARGLMQIMPKTGKMLARKLKHRWQSAAQLFQPETNLRYGTTYLKQLSDRFNNNLAMITAAYNAGPHRVERWRPEQQSIPADIWVEAIPFNETRSYVKAVLAYMSIYNHRLGGKKFRIDNVIADIPPSKSSTEAINIAKKLKEKR